MATVRPAPVRASVSGSPTFRVYSQFIVDPDDLLHYMDIEWSNIQEEAARMVLENLHDEMEAYINRPIVVTHRTRETHRVPVDVGGVSPNPLFSQNTLENVTEWGDTYNPYSGYYPLPLDNTPIIDIYSVTRSSDMAGITTLSESSYHISEFGLELAGAIPGESITVDYRGGLDGPTVKALRSIILRAAAREMQNMHDDVLGIKDLTAREVALKETGFLESEKKTLNRYRRVRA